MKFLSKEPAPSAPARSPQASSKGDELDGLNAFLGVGCRYHGKLAYEGTVRIDGQFSGEIMSDGTLIVGEGAELKAEIKVGTVIISGRVSGNIIAREKLELKRTAFVVGTIYSPVLKVAEGGIFEGTCRMGAVEVHSSVEEVTEEDAQAMALQPLSDSSETDRS